MISPVHAFGPLLTPNHRPNNQVCLLGFRNRCSAAAVRTFFDTLRAVGITTTTVPNEDLHPAYQSEDAYIMKLTKA